MPDHPQHRHVVHSTEGPDPFTNPARPPGRWANPAAHGGESFTDRCRCGATRARLVHGGQMETGPWVGGSARVPRGRPRGADAARREAPPVVCYVTPEERAELLAAAAAAGADVGPWVREVALQAARRV